MEEMCFENSTASVKGYLVTDLESGLPYAVKVCVYVCVHVCYVCACVCVSVCVSVWNILIFCMQSNYTSK